ncbi:MAG: isoprenylcysteine carboxylmethyltransferase family protein [Acidobacteria bacterium]|nr:isoprenylcysteine carboxylmethyltransferase family protein [Acidobacteriota bacterium]
MEHLPLIALAACWAAWAYPFVFLAPHNQKRASVTRVVPTRIGLALECAAIFIAFECRAPAWRDPGAARVIPGLLLGIAAPLLSWSAVRHLGRQFRVHAGLYEDHQLVRSGAYAVVRHPIYASLLAILGGTMCMLTRPEWAIASLVLFVAGTEIRVRTEDDLLRSRFGEEFERYRRGVKAYIPFVR